MNRRPAIIDLSIQCTLPDAALPNSAKNIQSPILEKCTGVWSKVCILNETKLLVVVGNNYNKNKIIGNSISQYWREFKLFMFTEIIINDNILEVVVVVAANVGLVMKRRGYFVIYSRQPPPLSCTNLLWMANLKGVSVFTRSLFPNAGCWKVSLLCSQFGSMQWWDEMMIVVLVGFVWVLAFETKVFLEVPQPVAKNQQSKLRERHGFNGGHCFSLKNSFCQWLSRVEKTSFVIYVIFELKIIMNQNIKYWRYSLELSISLHLKSKSTRGPVAKCVNW